MNQDILGEIKTESVLTKILNYRKKLFYAVELNAGRQTFKMSEEV
jgi:hypothetical protein